MTGEEEKVNFKRALLKDSSSARHGLSCLVIVQNTDILEYHSADQHVDYHSTGCDATIKIGGNFQFITKRYQPCCLLKTSQYCGRLSYHPTTLRQCQLLLEEYTCVCQEPCRCPEPQVSISGFGMVCVTILIFPNWDIQ